jgi:drug/metabolite transporter (DMT)-like permease
MTTAVLLAVLGAALLHAAWNAMAKGRSGSDPLLGTLVIGIGSGVAALPVLLVAGLPAQASHGYVLASTLVHIAYFVLVGLSYRVADYSAVYPLMRGSAPLLTTLAGAAFLAEPLPAALLAGVVLLSAGVLGLGWDALRRGGLDRRGLAVAACNVAVIVAYTLLDGLGARASGNPAAYVSAMLAATAVLLVPAIVVIGAADFARQALATWRIGLFGGAMAMTGYGIALWAMTQAPIGAVAALRETSVLFGTVIAALVLGERFGPSRWIATAAICAGLVLIRIG